MQLLKDIPNDVKEFVNFVNNINGGVDQKELKKFKTLVQTIYYEMCVYIRNLCKAKYKDEGEKSLNEILKTKENERPMPEKSYKDYLQYAGRKGADTAIKDVLYRVIYDLGSSLKRFSGDEENEKYQFSDDCLSKIVDAVKKGLQDSGKQNIKLDDDLKTIRGRANL